MKFRAAAEIAFRAFELGIRTTLPQPLGTPPVKTRRLKIALFPRLVTHPVQLAEPGWGSHPDAQPERAIATRREFVARYGDRPVLVIGTHFAGPTAGRIVKVGSSFRLVCD